jgi:hypothetical protein
MNPNTGKFFFSQASRPALVSTQPPAQRVPAHCHGGKAIRGVGGGDVVYSPPSSVEVKNTYSCTSCSSDRAS